MVRNYGTVFLKHTELRYLFRTVPYRTATLAHHTQTPEELLLAGWRQVTVIWVTDLGNVGVVQPYLFESIPQVESTSIGTSEYCAFTTHFMQ